ncbi:MAG: 3-phosphoshikimate 1-carboxyvinyltransferase [Candidatus Omnitrophota bacterium]
MFKIPLLTQISKEINIPPDKSISHRAAMLAAICKDTTIIKPFSRSDDTKATIDCLKRLGVSVKFNKTGGTLSVKGKGMYFPDKGKVTLYAAESGTTMRILSGILCAQRFPVCFNAAPSLKRRPMSRIVVPLTEMGANFTNLANSNEEKEIYPPLSIMPPIKISGNDFSLKIASAQVKSAILLASLYADRPTRVIEPYESRDHTERMLSLFGVGIKKKGTITTCLPTARLKSPKKIFIPSDFSSAAFFIVLALITKRSRLLIKNVNINPTRRGLLGVLKRMGARIKLVNKTDYYEPYADILVLSSTLKATEVKEEEIPGMIDEIPILAAAAAFAEGKTRIRGAAELKVKETDRVKAMLYNLRAAGVTANAATSNKNLTITIEGAGKFKQARFKSFDDHRTAMSAIVLGSATGKQCAIDDIRCINKSFPEFVKLIKSL